MHAYGRVWWRCEIAARLATVYRTGSKDLSPDELATLSIADADALVKKLKIDRVRKGLSESQRRIQQISEVFETYDEDPPKPSVIGKWIKTLGRVEDLIDLLNHLGEAGQLSKGHAYVFGAIKRRAQHYPPPGQKLVIRPDRYPDGFMLPTRARWCPELLKFLPEKEWLARRQDGEHAEVRG